VFTGLESPTHLIIVLVIVLVLFGGKRIPEHAKGLGTGVREFGRGLDANDEKDLDEGSEEVFENRDDRNPRQRLPTPSFLTNSC
jgi:sec-independent protein translocase protein TatA